MVALVEFCKDRRREIEHKESEYARKMAEIGYSRNENLVKDIVVGVQNAKVEQERAKQDYEAFCELFPYLRSEERRVGKEC